MRLALALALALPARAARAGAAWPAVGHDSSRSGRSDDFSGPRRGAAVRWTRLGVGAGEFFSFSDVTVDSNGRVLLFGEARNGSTGALLARFPACNLYNRYLPPAPADDGALVVLRTTTPCSEDTPGTLQFDADTFGAFDAQGSPLWTVLNSSVSDLVISPGAARLHAIRYVRLSASDQTTVLQLFSVSTPALTVAEISWSVNVTEVNEDFFYRSASLASTSPYDERGEVLFVTFDGFASALLLTPSGGFAAELWVRTDGEVSNCGPTVGRFGRVYYVGSSYLSGAALLVAFDVLTGETLWSFAPPESPPSTPGIGGVPRASIGLIDGAEVVYVGSSSGVLFAVVGATGAPLWSFSTRGALTAPTVGADGTVYAGSCDGNFYALDGATGALLWSFATVGGTGFSQRCVGTAAIGNDGALFFAADDGVLYALEEAPPPPPPPPAAAPAGAGAAVPLAASALALSAAALAVGVLVLLRTRAPRPSARSDGDTPFLANGASVNEG